jgi:Holliday junction resolvase RusA-like endonuclease
MQHKLIIPAPIPSKKNNRRNFRKVSLPSEAYVNWHQEVIASLEYPPRPFTKCHIDLIYHIGSKHRRDLDNALTSVLDLLVDAGIIMDDSWSCVTSISASSVFSKGIWYAEVTITDEDGDNLTTT